MAPAAWDETLGYLSANLDENCYKTIVAARQFSLTRLDALGSALRASPRAIDVERLKAVWVVTGSLGRLESLEASDIDLTLICPSGVDPHSDQIKAIDQETRNFVRETMSVAVSQGHDWTSPTSVQQVADVGLVGGLGDDNRCLTKRVLLITESRPVLPGHRLGELRRGLMGAYLESTQTTGKNLLTLTNDIVRYYRTLCIDYKSTVDLKGKAWAPRNQKLRHARKYWFFATMLAIVHATAMHEEDNERAEAAAAAAFEITPTERLLGATKAAGIDAILGVVTWYNLFLGMIGEPKVRDGLEHVPYGSRYDHEVFRRLQDNSKRLTQAMLDIVENLPPVWRRHVLQHFLL